MSGVTSPGWMNVQQGKVRGSVDDVFGQGGKASAKLRCLIDDALPLTPKS